MPKEKLPLPVKAGLVIVNVAEILYVKSDDMWVHVQMQDGQCHRVPLTIKKLSAESLRHFVRSHRSYLVNTLHMKRYNKVECTLELTGGVSVPVSRRKRREVVGSIMNT